VIGYHCGTGVTAIQGSWVCTTSDNLAAVNRHTAGGSSLGEAAKQTWTGDCACSYGFTKVEVIGTPTGQPGAYTDVRVRFKKEGG
jgi:hypothetical protein